MTVAIVTNVLRFSTFQKYFSLGLPSIEYKNVFDHKLHLPLHSPKCNHCIDG